jgi:hypothetical protein
MPRYQVAFSDRWLTGRWGFTDRVITGLGGKALEPAGGHNAWQVPFAGTSFELGRFLTDALKIPLSRDAEAGGVFEVEELEPGGRVRRKIRSTTALPRAAKPDESSS